MLESIVLSRRIATQGFMDIGISDTFDPDHCEQCVAAILGASADLSRAIDGLVAHGVHLEKISVIGRAVPRQSLARINAVDYFDIPLIGRVMLGGPLKFGLLELMAKSERKGTRSGLVFFFMCLGIPVQQAAIYQTCLQKDDILIVVNTNLSQSKAVQECFESIDAQESLVFSSTGIN